MILVIDDNDQHRVIVREMLEASGYEVRDAADGHDGAALVETLRPELVLCDLMMPNRDGFETVRDILARVPDTKIVAMSGLLFGAADHATMARNLGLAAILEKPFRFGQLLDIVRAALGSGRHP